MIDTKLLAAIENFFNHPQQIKFEGEKEDENGFGSLPNELKAALPPWYVEFLTTFPINGLIIDFEVNPDDERSIEFVGFEGVQDEFYDLYPGCAIGQLGYICIGEDPTGSGDPYFINIHEGENPPVYQIYHDVSDVGEEIIQGGRDKVAGQLSELFVVGQ
ncbi:SMI1/KNR4 family protein [Lewinella sp. W8]|uniref:SMI1/KNR4 family protein n=1 Tax=Lewinella sp. W8 TaxID=2528208 RepID=UPI001068C61F|nr:SMI1/KNR4 family protein [Lewinella sp. W8]MTB49771.1 hypothetical protein [Lewinella sp. W8]